MNDYKAYIPSSIEDDVDYFYDYLFEYGEETAERFRADFKKKINQIERCPFSCAVDAVYPSLAEMGVRKAVINKDRYLVLYFVEGRQIVIIAVERAERDYITTFEANLKFYEETDKRDG